MSEITVALSQEFLEAYARIPRRKQGKVLTMVTKFRVNPRRRCRQVFPTPVGVFPPRDAGACRRHELRAMRRELVALREEVHQIRDLPAPDARSETKPAPEPPGRPQEPREADTPTTLRVEVSATWWASMVVRW
ncbi:hypothetical protein [Halomonas sp.]|uniref:hypothetical protein n=1 Tax=Halomonas sp. TaxID=1486246 RepID=UPI0035662921